MPGVRCQDNKLELVIEVQADKANASIKGVNQGLAGIEKIAVSVARNASSGIDGMTASMVKGSPAGNLLAEAIKGAAEWVKEYVAGAVEMGAHTERLTIGTQVLAKARGMDAKVARDQIEAIKQIGYTTENATEIINRMLGAGQNLERSQALAKDLYAAGIGTSPAETVEKMVLAIEPGQSRGLRSLGLWVDLTTKQEIAALKAGHALSEEEKSTVAYNSIMQKAWVALGTTAAAAENAETQQHKLGLATCIIEMRPLPLERDSIPVKVLAKYVDDVQLRRRQRRAPRVRDKTMNYCKRIVCLANSRKPGGRCLAGKEVLPDGYGAWIRPVSARPSAEISLDERQYENGKEPEILDIIDIPMIAAVPRIHQTENHMIDAERYWTKRDELSWGDLGDLVDAPVALWKNGDSTYHGTNDRVTQAVTSEFKNSLFLIEPADITIRVLTPGAAFGNPKRRVRAGFTYQGTHYDLMVTDPLAEAAFLARPNGEYALADAYFCISLAEAHTDGYCYKLAATIISERPL